MRLGRVLSIAWLVLALPATAQQYASQARGLGGAVAYQSGGVDHVNLFNGQLSVTLPLGPSYPVGPGFSYGLGLTYSANPWEHSFQSCITQTGAQTYYWPEIDPKPNAGLWRVSLGQLGVGVNSAAYTAPDGTEISLYPELHPGIPAAGSQLGVLFSNNSSYMRLFQSSAAAQCHTVTGTPAACWVSGSLRQIPFKQRAHRSVGADLCVRPPRPAGTVYW